MHGMRCKTPGSNKNMIYLKVNKTENSEITAICDADLIGKTFSENDIILNVNENFYKGYLMQEKEILSVLKKARNVNITGKKSINLAVKAGIIDEESIIYVNKVPHAIAFEL